MLILVTVVITCFVLMVLGVIISGMLETDDLGLGVALLTILVFLVGGIAYISIKIYSWII